MLKPMNRLSQQGFTLTELMVGLLVSSMLIGSAIMMLSSTVRNNHDTMYAIKLNQELQGALELMGSEIRRSGYWANANTDVSTNANTNPFMQSATDVTINGTKDCILISYDNNSDGAIPALNAGTDDERYGYRLNGTAIQARPSSAAFSCTAASNAWEDLTDPNTIVITALQFNQSDSTIDLDGADPGTASIMIRNIEITITGHHVDRPSVNKTLTYQVRLRNDKFIP